jgi:hypothetical protein
LCLPNFFNIYIFRHFKKKKYIFNYVLLKIIKILYFESSCRNKSNNISFTNICMYSLYSKIHDLFDHCHVCQCTTLIVNIINHILLKIIKILYFESTRWDKYFKLLSISMCQCSCRVCYPYVFVFVGTHILVSYKEKCSLVSCNWWTCENSQVYVYICNKLCKITLSYHDFNKIYTLNFNKITISPWFRKTRCHFMADVIIFRDKFSYTFKFQ